MAAHARFGKPNMTNLPSELGIAIFKQILNTPRYDYEKRRAETKELEKKMLEVRLKENAERDSSK